MNCPKCQFPLSEDMAFCPECGEKASDTQRVVMPEKSREDTLGATTVIPVLGTHRSAEPKADKEIAAEPKREKPKAKKAPKAPSNTKTKVLTILVACLVTVAAGLGITIAAIFAGTMYKAGDTGTIQTTDTNDINDEKEQEKEIAPDEPEVGESIGVPEKTGIKIDTLYPFATGKKLSSSALEYKTLRNSEFAYKCDIPSEFVFLSDIDGEIRYGASDKTAYMDIGAFANRDAADAGDIKAMISHELGASAEYEVSGDDWFVMRTVKSGVVYCHKCFASEDFVRYIEFVYPSEYSEVYDVYVNDIEATFEKIN